MTTTKEIGARGEDIATAHLTSLGYRVVERNWMSGRGVHCTGEIDIIASKDDKLFFIEVKTRNNYSTAGEDFSAEAAFNYRKIEKMRSAVDAYLKEKEYLGEIEVALIAINLKKNGTFALRLYNNLRIF